MKRWLPLMLLLACSSAHAQSLDIYGGTTGLTCPAGAKPHFYTQKIGSRWAICDPLGNYFFLKALAFMTYGHNETTFDVVFPNQDCTASLTPRLCCTGPQTGTCGGKYGSSTVPYAYVTTPNQTPGNVWPYAWATANLQRLNSWGFDASGDESLNIVLPFNHDNVWNTTDQTLPSQFRMPAGMEPIPVTNQGFRNIAPCGSASALKDMINGVATGFPTTKYNSGDYFDPAWTTCLSNLLAPSNTKLPTASTPHGDYVVYYTIDEDGQVGWTGPGPDYQSIGPQGNVGGNNANSYNAALLTLITSPVQTSNSTYGQTYTDCNVYNKLQLVSDLVTEYTTIGALNTAWGSSYTGFYSSQSGFTTAGNWGAGHPNCSGYTAWGSGTGLLDEDGRTHNWLGDLCSLTGSASSSPPRQCGSYLGATYAAETTAMQADMSAELKKYAIQYYSTVTAAWHANYPGIMLMFDPGGFGNPAHKEIYQAIASGTTNTRGDAYLDLVQGTVPEYCTNCTDMQSRIDFIATNLGDKPITEWIGYSANLDSSESAHGGANSIATTQAGKQTVYDSQMTQIATSHTTGGTFPLVGFYYWDHTDEDSEGLNWGWISVYDNPYDGVASNQTYLNTRTWTASHSYAAPQTIFDGNNYETMTDTAFVTGTCVSGGSAPAWATQIGLETTDNTCVWRNEGPYVGVIEQNLPTTATIPSKAYGDFVSSAAAANNALYSQILTQATATPTASATATATATSTPTASPTATRTATSTATSTSTATATATCNPCTTPTVTSTATSTATATATATFTVTPSPTPTPACNTLVGPCNPWPWSATTGGNLVTNGSFGTTGNCNLTGWNQTVQPGNSIVSQSSVTDGSPCAAQINTMHSGVGVNQLYQTIHLNSGWYKLEANVASTGNDQTLFTLQYSNVAATDALVVVQNNFVTVTGVPQTTSLQTIVCTASGCHNDQCFNLNRLNSDNCSNPTQYLTIQQLITAINAVPGYTATLVAAPSIGTSTMEPTALDIFASPANLPGVNTGAGGRCSIGGVNLNVGAAGVLGNSSSFKYTHNLLWHNLNTENTTLKCQTTGNVNGNQYFDSVKLTQLQAAPVDLIMRYPNDRFTEFNGLDVQVDYMQNQANACSGVGGCGANQCGIQLRNGSTVISTQCVTPTSSWQTLTVPFAAQSTGSTYNVIMVGNSYVPQINFRKTASVPASWNYHIDPTGWFHYAGSSTPHLSVGTFDTSNFYSSVNQWQGWLNGVFGTPNPILSIGESGTTVTVATKNNHGLSVGSNFAAAQFLTPLAASGFTGNHVVASVIDNKTFTYTAASGLPASDLNDGVIGGAVVGAIAQGSVGTIARIDTLQDYVNYFITNAPMSSLNLLGTALSGDGVIQSQVINDQYTPFNALNPVVNGPVCSADPLNTGCYCTNGGTFGSNANWGPNGSHLCGPTPGPGYSSQIYCSVYCPDDINDRYTQTDGQPSMGQLYEYDEPPEEYFLSVLGMQQYTRSYTADFALSGVLLGLGLPDVYRFTPFRDADLPGVDNYALYANIPQGGPNPAFQPSLTFTGTFPANPGIQQSTQMAIIAENGNPFSNPITFGVRPVRTTLQYFGYSTGTRWPNQNQLRAEAWQAITAGAQAIDWWSMGLDGLYSLRSCPDFASNARACQAEFLGFLHNVMAEIRKNEAIITGQRVALDRVPPAGVTYFASLAPGPCAGPNVTWVVEENNNAKSVTDGFNNVLGPVGSGQDLLIFMHP